MNASSEVYRRASAYARRQHHLLTREQLLGLGASPGQVHRWTTAGLLQRVDRSVYLLPGGVHDWPTRLHAVCLSTGGVASHRSAAALWGLERCRPGTPEITVPRGRSTRHAGIRVHESRDLGLIRPETVDGVPTTPPERTLLDLGAVAPAVVEAATLDAIDRRVTSWDRLLEVFVQHARPGRDGAGPLRAVLDRHYGDQAGSHLERQFLSLILAAGLPRPEQQVPVYDGRGLVMVLDFAFTSVRVAVELDGLRFHANARAYEADARKRNRLKLLGWLLLVFTSRRIRDDPVGVCEEVAAAVRQRSTR
jgi:hypothetical protein